MKEYAARGPSCTLPALLNFMNTQVETASGVSPSPAFVIDRDGDKIERA